MSRKKTRKKVFLLAGSCTIQQAEVSPKEEYKLTKEILNLIKNGGNVKESPCYYGGRTSHQVHQF